MTDFAQPLSDVDIDDIIRAPKVEILGATEINISYRFQSDVRLKAVNSDFCFASSLTKFTLAMDCSL